MDKGISYALLAVGIILFLLGISAPESLGSDMSRLATGAPTDKTVWLLIIGVSVAIIGLFGVLRGMRTT